uniref:Uncharacterized protein n=1 Tax=Oryza punctata TaxID=4537 RepID=A0A0E0JVL8_ORYPU
MPCDASYLVEDRLLRTVVEEESMKHAATAGHQTTSEKGKREGMEQKREEGIVYLCGVSRQSGEGKIRQEATARRRLIMPSPLSMTWCSSTTQARSRACRRFNIAVPLWRSRAYKKHFPPKPTDEV